MSSSKREEVSSHLRYIREELRYMDEDLRKHGLIPVLTEVRAVYEQLVALYDLIQGKKKKQAKTDFEDAA